MRHSPRLFGLLAVVSATAVSLLGVTAAPPATAAPSVATTTVLGSSLNPSTAGDTVTLTASVTGSGGTPTGTVRFEDSGAVLVDVPVDGAGVASFATSGLTTGTHALTATYLGDATFDTSTGPLTQTVNAAPAPAPVAAPVVTPAPKPVKKPSVRLSASTKKLSVGDKLTLKWKSKRADQTMASGDWGGAQKDKGTKVLRINDRGKHTFKLTVQNATGRATAKVTVLASRKAKDFDLTVTDEIVVGGSKVAVAADGLASGETYTVRLAGKPVFTGKANGKGDVEKSFVVRKDVEGTLPLTITGSNPRRAGTAELVVIMPVKTLDIEVKKDKLKVKELQTITVRGLAVGEEVTVTYLGEDLVTRKVGADGTFAYAFPIAGDPGLQTVTVLGQVPGRAGQTSFTVTKKKGGGLGGSVPIS